MVIGAGAAGCVVAARLASSMGLRSRLRWTIKQATSSVPHVVGTCAMGPSTDARAVVDGSGRVHGTTGLFVVDASIMPTVPSGFTHLSTIAIAEKLAETVTAVL